MKNLLNLIYFIGTVNFLLLTLAFIFPNTYTFKYVLMSLAIITFIEIGLIFYCRKKDK